jgi:hypothetical protein
MIGCSTSSTTSPIFEELPPAESKMTMSVSEEMPVKIMTAPSRNYLRPTAMRAVYSNILQRGGRIQLSWRDNSGDELVFRIQRRTGITEDWVYVGTVDSNMTSYLDYNLRANQTYYYRVQYSKEDYNSPFSNIASARVGDFDAVAVKNTN